MNWLPPVNPNGVIISYEIEDTTNSTFTTISGTVLTQNSLTHYNWTGPEFPTYYMRVRAVNSVNTDTGTMSEPSNVIKLCLGLDRDIGTYSTLLCTYIHNDCFMVKVNNPNWTMSLIGMLIERSKQYYMNSCKSPKNFILSKIRKLKNQPLQKNYIYLCSNIEYIKFKP